MSTIWTSQAPNEVKKLVTEKDRRANGETLEQSFEHNF